MNTEQGWYQQGKTPRRIRLVLTLCFGLSAALLGGFSLFLPGQQIPMASAHVSHALHILHALPIRSEPTADAVLTTPPQDVQMWFSEDLIPQTSRLLVVDTTNRQVDNQDSQATDANAMRVTLPLLPAGTYVVVWRTQSAIDGHIASGSFLFRIARPDGTVPPIPTVLPTGHVPGAAGTGISGGSTLDGPTLLQTLMTWLALMFLTFWVGGCIWETWVLPPDEQQHADLAQATEAARQRFRLLAPLALGLLLVANLGIVLGQSAELAGDWLGVLSLPLLRVILLNTSFGFYWWMRQVSVLLALLLVRKRQALQYSSLPPNDQEQESTSRTCEASPLTWWQAVKESFWHLPRFPRHLASGWSARSLSGKLELVLGALLILAFALSGHAAAVTTSPRTLVVSVDLLHLLGDAAWVGGLLYLGVVLVPVLRKLSTSSRARVLMRGFPTFSAFALVSVTVLAATGSLNTTEHLNSFDQLLSTLYGRILSVKIGLFLLMAALSASHAFFLRACLAQTLARQSKTQRVALSTGIEGDGQIIPSRGEREAGRYRERIIKKLAARMAGLLQLEAAVGAAVLLCVALLGASAGTLAPSLSAPAATNEQAGGAFLQTRHAQGYAVTLQVTPATFGPNTFTVTITDEQGRPISGAAVLVTTTMLDMDMGTQSLQLQPVGGTSSNRFSGQSDLTMAGHWMVLVKILPPNHQRLISYTFTFSTTPSA